MKMLFLDDSVARQDAFRSRCPWATIVATAEEAIDALQRDQFAIISLDHDLGGVVYVESAAKDTGAEVARWLAVNKHNAKLVIVHSLNPSGSKEMAATLNDAGYNVQQILFTRFKELKVCELLNSMRDELSNA